MLMGDVIAKDNEISALRSTMEAMSTSSGGNINEKKLLQLSKENKSLRVEISKEQSKARQATEELKKLKTKVMEPATKKGWSSAASSMLQEEEYKKKYRETDKLYQDAKFKHYAVKQELKKAMKVIQREVGQEVTNLESLVSNESWRGRAQQITLLQSKLSDMKRKMGTMTKTTENFAPASVRASPPGKAEERRKQIEDLSQEVLDLKSELERSRKQAKGNSSRKTAMERELKEIRVQSQHQVKTLLEKADNDDKLIKLLKAELDKKHPEGVKPSAKVISNEGSSLLKYEIKELEEQCEAYKAELEQKDEIIAMFQMAPKDEAFEGEDDYQEQIQYLQQQLSECLEELEEHRSKPKGVSEDAKIIKDLSSQNAMLRRKMDDLQQKLSQGT